jgi:hypothetical protein
MNLFKIIFSTNLFGNKVSNLFVHKIEDAPNLSRFSSAMKKRVLMEKP